MCSLFKCTTQKTAQHSINLLLRPKIGRLFSREIKRSFDDERHRAHHKLKAEGREIEQFEAEIVPQWQQCIIAMLFSIIGVIVCSSLLIDNYS